MLIDTGHRLPIVKQCALLDMHRSGHYYQPRKESVLNLELMRKIDEAYLCYPFYGVPRMWNHLRNELGYTGINKKRVERLYKLMGIEAIGPKPNTSRPAFKKGEYPYLLRNLRIEHPNQVWAVDITYIPMYKGFMYLFAILDIFSRYVVNWSISNNMESAWCAEALTEARDRFGDPQIINSDQGSQFSSEDWKKACKGLQISMDGKGRAIDNIFIERFWRSLKYEYVYLNPATEGTELYWGIEKYINFYNHERGHQTFGYSKPYELYQQIA